MTKTLSALLCAMLALPAMGQMMSGPMMTTRFFPLVDGARYDYLFVRGPHLAATAVMHGGQHWAGASGLTGVHMTFTCRDDTPCDFDRTDFYGMGPDGMHHFGGSAQAPDGTHYMASLSTPGWMLKNPVMPGTMMGTGATYPIGETWQAGVAGMNTMMGPQGYMNAYQALALETVVTPVATFPNALHVHERHGSGYERDVWYVADVGIVRWLDAGEEAVLAEYTKAARDVPMVAFAVEYYHGGLDHYFVTADVAEVAALDGGHHSGWQRTGLGFNVFAPADTTGAGVAVCRLYGNPAYGLDTHFYSASSEECAETQHHWPGRWTFESANVFRMAMPDRMTGACPIGTMPVFRTWNQRSDTNHRYTMDPVVQLEMEHHGGMAEGYGAMPVAMCSPQ